MVEKCIEWIKEYNKNLKQEIKDEIKFERDMKIHNFIGYYLIFLMGLFIGLGIRRLMGLIF